MRKLIATLLLGLLPSLGFAAGGAQVDLEPVDIDLTDKPSLQRGAKLFVNYCLSCHGASFHRYMHLAEDLELTDDQIEDNLMFTTDKIGDTMQVAITKKDAETWFGTKIPDLSLTARSRGPEWLYNYLISFYVDPSRPWGVNNRVFKDVGMPHVLWELQGLYAPVYHESKSKDGEAVQKIADFELVRAGSMDEREFENAMRDLTNFMTYLSEPAKLDRQRIGVWVLLFLVVLSVVLYLLKKEYWKDVH